MKKTGKDAEKHRSHYYSIRQFRLDKWIDLRETAKKITQEPTKQELVTLREQLRAQMDQLMIVEKYWAYPGIEYLRVLDRMIQRKEMANFAHSVTETVQSLTSESFRSDPWNTGSGQSSGILQVRNRQRDRHYFEVLVVDDLSLEEERDLKTTLAQMRTLEEPYFYNIVVVRSFKDALNALSFNFHIQACVIRHEIPYKNQDTPDVLRPFVSSFFRNEYKERKMEELGAYLGALLKRFRPSVDRYLVTEEQAGDLDDRVLLDFKRVFYRKEDLQELHLSIMGGIKERFETPFFSALVEYSQKPTGVFHAMPISRGNSIFKSRWIRDFADFYGRNLLLAETSSTSGGLDSLLQPKGPLKKSQQLAAKAFGAQQTFFVTNGTSTANKIVVQALVKPDDIVLVDRDCHKSHHYAMVLSGATVIYLDSYPIEEFSMYGAVPLSEIKHQLLTLKEAGRLDKVKMLLLTNCTFDGVIYNVQRVMEEVLAIKPDMIFLWDEAWFASAAFVYAFRQRTAMYVADKLYKKYNSSDYRKAWEKAQKAGKTEGMVDPDQVKIRVYSTQSTHKTLSSLRQGSMIHVWDEEFKRKSQSAFNEAYMTHTSTSPNYQILASLDIGRRQVEFEGYELVERSVELAMMLRQQIMENPSLNKYFQVLTIKDVIPEDYRLSGLSEYYDPDLGWAKIEDAFVGDEFVLDPTKINVAVGKTGVNGNTFKNEFLMDQFGIQINKTSRNTVLFMTNIGTTQSSVAYLLKSLHRISEQMDQHFRSLTKPEMEIAEAKIRSLCVHTPPLPNFSRFHHSFRAVPEVPGGLMREAYFLAYDEEMIEYRHISECLDIVRNGGEVVSATFVTPYPPGFPILVPGQVMSEEILEFMVALDVKEIHGYQPEMGLKVFTEQALADREMESPAKVSVKANGNGHTASTLKKEKQKPHS